MLRAYPVHFSCAFLALLGSVILLLGTGWGIGLSPDSAVYIEVSRNLLSANGFRVPSYTGEWAPVVYYPPLFPTLLAGIGLFGVDPVQGARWLSVALFGSNILLIGLFFHAATRSFFLALSASFLILISFPIVFIHSMAWSEPLFIFLGVLGVFLLGLYVEKADGWLLMTASVAAGLASLTRYAGISLIVTGMVAIPLLTQRPWRKKLLHTAVFGFVSCAPAILWITRNVLVTGTATGRKIAFHPLGNEHWESFMNTIATWLFPISDLPLARALSLFALALLGLVYRLASRQGKLADPEGSRRSHRLPALFGIFFLAYSVLLALSISFFDAQTPLDDRILSPLYVATALLFLCLLHILLRTPKTKSTRASLFLMGVVLASLSGSQLIRTASWLEYSYRNGVGYASREWNQSQLMKYVKGLDLEVPVFTNGPDIIGLLTGRPAYMIPRRIDPGTNALNSHYVDEVAAMNKLIQEKKGVVVYFSRITWRWYLAPENAMNEEFNLSPIMKAEDGTVYR